MLDSEHIPFAVPDIGEAEIEAVANSMRSGWITTGPNCSSFEKEFASFLGANQLETVAVNSATAGLHLALEALGVGEGDEVLVPTWTFTATAEVVSYLGATPVFVDIEPSAYTINFTEAQKVITERTKAIMPVHFAGRPISRKAIEEFASSNKLLVVEDAAHAFPASSEGTPVGCSNAEAIVFSFYATKTMTTGEGGMVATKDINLARRMRTMRLHGINGDVFNRYNSDRPKWYYEVVAAGFKYNLTDIAASMGRVQLARSPDMREKREFIANFYLSELADVRDVRLPRREEPGDIHAWHLFTIEILRNAAMSRDEFIQAMSKEGIGTSVHFIPLHLQPHWRSAYALRAERFPVSNAAYEQIVSLPIFSGMSRGQQRRVVETVKELLG